MKIIEGASLPLTNAEVKEIVEENYVRMKHRKSLFASMEQRKLDLEIVKRYLSSFDSSYKVHDLIRQDFFLKLSECDAMNIINHRPKNLVDFYCCIVSEDFSYEDIELLFEQYENFMWGTDGRHEAEEQDNNNEVMVID
eukprot:GHVP01061624.1.p1 GENE.GHVP01061624.1~~GHVP01061624.1.p1  ORF type:complete len:139 (+),score=28.75 GHVP01061624.1:6-422(+)